MDNYWLLLITVLLWPCLTWAASIPTAGDLVLQYNQESVDKQAKHNYLFTVAGDSIIYTCETDHCNMSQFKGRGNINVTIYKLLDSFPRPQTVPNQAILHSYLAQAQQQYSLDNIPTDLANTERGLPYQLVELGTDGSSQFKTQYYLNVDEPDNSVHFNIPSWLWWLLGIGGIGIAVGGTVWWRLRRLRSL